MQYPLAFCPDDESVFGYGCQNLSTVQLIRRRHFGVFLTKNCRYCSHLKSENITLWILLPVSHHLRKLKIIDCPLKKPDILPSSLYNCKSLATLKLSGGFRLDVPRMVCLPSLKILRLDDNRFLDGGSLQRLLSVCTVLEDLLVNCKCDYIDNMGLVTVTVPSLQRLSFYIPSASSGLLDGLVIDTPSLKYLKLQNLDKEGHPCLIKSCMPNLEEAYVDFRYHDVSSLIGGITLVKRLTICLEDVVYNGSFVFNQLEHCLYRCYSPVAIWSFDDRFAEHMYSVLIIGQLSIRQRIS